MDTGAAGKQAEEAGIALIKSAMPETYKSIQAKAREIGQEAYMLVRRSLRGEANCFWACERGNVVGTPFAGSEIERDTAHLMMRFGATFVCMWGQAMAGVTQ